MTAYWGVVSESTVGVAEVIWVALPRDLEFPLIQEGNRAFKKIINELVRIFLRFIAKPGTGGPSAPFPNVALHGDPCR